MNNKHSHVATADILYLIQSDERMIKGYQGRIRMRPNHQNAPNWMRFIDGLESSLKSLKEEYQKRQQNE